MAEMRTWLARTPHEHFCAWLTVERGLQGRHFGRLDTSADGAFDKALHRAGQQGEGDFLWPSVMVVLYPGHRFRPGQSCMA